ncbi:hypothetical protein KFK09_005355 [Dendrobium nobile]|uniref:Uncharacterized protein n=1 Tax=Dendrobium nobile TaxID=94219 RepID=A0A8T3C128_DENNO|nr:hypothetical protein KFK09_005355 [Dendrobium nobile]
MMDPKASAKAKRSYSQQGRRKHPSPAAIAQKKKAAQVGSEAKVQRERSHDLPSNLDRYDEGEDEAESSSGTALEEGGIPPKSKGADFVYLIEQARSQQHELGPPTLQEAPSFFDELATDFMKGVSFIHTVRRKNLLSRCEDDNFVVDVDLTSSYEIPFLNLDLHAIDAQLSKIKLSERLFIEEDLLPEDLHFDDSKGSSSSFQSEKLEEIGAGQNMEEPNLLGHTEDPSTTIFPNPNISQAYPAQGNHQETTVGANTGQQCDIRETEESLGNISKSSTLKVREAEAELDMLLESFKEIGLSGSIQDKPSSNISFDESLPFHWKSDVNRKQPADAIDDSPNSDFFYPMQQQSIDQGQVPSKNTVATSIDDSIDDLLAETSSILKMQKHIRAPAPMFSTTNSFQPHSSSSSIDDLLGGRKSIAIQNGPASSEAHSSNPDSKAQMDDFDSWMDSF